MEAVETIDYIRAEDKRDLAKLAQSYMSATKMTIADLARNVKYSPSVISRFLSGTYGSDTTKLEETLRDFLKNRITMPEKVKSAIPEPVKRLNFFESKDAQSVVGVCTSCQEYGGLGIIVGRSGYGKTHTLKYYAKMPKVAYIECDDSMGIRDLMEAIEGALGLPKSSSTAWTRISRVREFCIANPGYLLIVDEADKLIGRYTSKKIEILRAIFDQAPVGLILAGEPMLEVQIRSNLARLANRVDFYSKLKGLSPKEVDKYLDGYDINADALAELKARACNSNTGCFRLLDRTLKNVTRILEEQNTLTVTLAIINQASSMMML